MAALEPDHVPVARPARSDSARYGVAVRASNLRAWVTARLVSSVPLIPPGKPR